MWPGSEYRRAFDALVAAQPAREAARTMVGLLALAHDRGSAGLIAVFALMLKVLTAPGVEGQSHRDS